MKRVLTVMAIVATGIAISGVALAWGPGMGPGWRGAGAGGPGPGWMAGGPMMSGGPGWMGGGMMGAGCAGFNAAGGQVAPISEDKAREIATEYVQKYFQGFAIERIVPFTGRLHTMYQVELKGPKGETRYLHVTPWGGVRPWGSPIAS